MAYEEALQVITLKASADLTTFLYCFVKVDGNGEAAAPALNGADAIGILQDEPKARGRAGRVAFGGVSKIYLAADLAAGAHITCDATGKAIAVGGNIRVGTLLEGGVSGQLVSALIDKR